jgi:outer membrane receptor for ferrienterochelin and colicins
VTRAGRIAFVIALFASAHPAVTSAQQRDTVFALDSIVVTAGRREQLLRDVVVTTELISRREIEASGAADVSAVLLSHSGVQLDAGTPTGAGVYLQGLGSQRVLVLLDGQPIVGRIGGNLDLARLSTALIERIEIVKGPQSTMYGSEAMGGVINLITRRPSKLALAPELRMVGGTQGRVEANGSVSGTRDTWAYRVDAGRRQIDLMPGVSGNTETFAHHWDGGARLTWQASEGARVDATALVIDEDQRYRTGQLYRFADRVQANARISAELVGAHSRFVPALHLSRFEHLSRASTEPRPVTEDGQRDIQTLVQADLLYGGAFGDNVLLDAGIELRREQITADRVVGAHALHSVEPFAQLTYTWRDLSVVPGARLTWSEQWGSRVTPRIAALYRFTPSLSLRASLAAGFRAPDFKELYLDFVNSAAGYAVAGNPALTPEQSRTASLNAEWTRGSWFLRGNAFQTHFDDFIETGEQDGAGVFTYANIADGSTSGIEIDAGGALGAAQLEGGVSLLRTRDDATGNPLLGRPPRSVRLSVGVPLFQGTRVHGTAIHTGSVPLERAADGTISRTRGAYTRLDARVTHQLMRTVSLAIGAENLLDARNLDWPGYTGRRLSAAAAWSPAQR